MTNDITRQDFSQFASSNEGFPPSLMSVAMANPDDCPRRICDNWKQYLKFETAEPTVNKFCSSFGLKRPER